MSARTRLATLAPLLICLLSIAPIGAPQAPEGERRAPVPEFVGTHRDWNVYKFQDSNETICYMASEPKKQEGNYTRRGNPAVLVTRRPTPRVVYEVSVQPGYSYAEGSDVEVQIDRQKFLMFTRGEHAWAKDEDTDEALITAMKQGNEMRVRGTSSRETYSLDTYSLLGFTSAHQAMLNACAD